MATKFYKIVKKIVAKIYSLRLLFLLRLFFGYYFKVSKSKPFSYFARLYCICVCIIASVTYTSHVTITTYYFNIFEYIYFVVLSLIFADDWFFKYCNNIRSGDAIMGFKKVSLVPTYMHIIIFVKMCFRVTTANYRYFSKFKINKYSFFSIGFASSAMDLNYILVTIIFSILHSRIRLLRGFIKNKSALINISGHNEISARIKSTRRSLYNYDHLLDNILMVDKQIQYMLVGLLAAYLPKTIIRLFDMVKKTFIDNNVSFMIITILEVMENLYLFSCPAVLAELAMYEVDQIKTTLAKQLTRCADDSLRYELEAALQYITLRPFSYTICRVVPFNINLIFVTFSLSITYVIVVIQFTHFNQSTLIV